MMKGQTNLFVTDISDDARAVAEKKAQFLEILGSKQEQKLQNLSEEELLAKINAL